MVTVWHDHATPYPDKSRSTFSAIESEFPWTEEIRLEISATAKFSNKFARDSPYTVNTFCCSDKAQWRHAHEQNLPLRASGRPRTRSDHVGVPSLHFIAYVVVVSWVVSRRSPSHSKELPRRPVRRSKYFKSETPPWAVLPMQNSHSSL